jgi:hypothetical protein
MYQFCRAVASHWNVKIDLNILDFYNYIFMTLQLHECILLNSFVTFNPF